MYLFFVFKYVGMLPVIELVTYELLKSSMALIMSSFNFKILLSSRLFISTSSFSAYVTSKALVNRRFWFIMAIEAKC